MSGCQHAVAARDREHQSEGAAGLRLEKPQIGLVDNHRTYVGSIADVVDARELGEMPFGRLLRETKAKIGHGIGGGGLAVAIIGEYLRAADHLERGREAAWHVGPVERSIDLILRH